MLPNPMNLLAQMDDPQAELFKEPGEGSTYWFPVQASDFASDIDNLFMLIFWVSLAFFAAIIFAMVYFVMKYRYRPGHKPQKSPSHNTMLEIAWSVLPGFLLIWFFIDGANGYFRQRIIPGDCENIDVVAKQFDWTFYYPDGDSTPSATGLHLVVNRPVQLTMESHDVLHSFFVPAFRQKQDVVPGRYTYTWFKPTRTGIYRIYCSEYCGDQHSLMRSIVQVHDTPEERKAATRWEWGEKSPRENGERLFKIQCAGCHNPTTEAKTGPGLAEIWGKTETMADGSTITVDDDYFRESLLEPNAKVVEGYAVPSQMTSFDGKLNDEQILWLRIYIRSLTAGMSEEEPAADGETPAEGEAAADGEPVADNEPADEGGAGESVDAGDGAGEEAAGNNGSDGG